MALAPAAGHVGEHWQDRQFVIIVPKKERIVPEKEQTKEDDDETSDERATAIASPM
jgi:hypothetical protein